jgi:energy-coupling factor transport system ATP-binding protein
MEVLGEVRRTTGVIVVTHDAEEFLDAADRVLVLTEGRTAFSGTAAELLGDPTPLVAAGVGLPPLLDVQMRARDCGVVLGRLEATPAKAAEGVASALLGGPR